MKSKFVLGAHLALLRANSWFCTQESLPEVLGGPYVVLGIMCAKQAYYVLYYHSGMRNTLLNDFAIEFDILWV